MRNIILIFLACFCLSGCSTKLFSSKPVSEENKLVLKRTNFVIYNKFNCGLNNISEYKPVLTD